MLVKNILGNVYHGQLGDREIDTVNLHWYELEKRVLRKVSTRGRDIGIYLEDNTGLTDGDILILESEYAVVVNLLPEEVISINPGNINEMGEVCYFLGNRHVPVIITESEVVTVYDAPLWEALQKQGFNPLHKKQKVAFKRWKEGHSHKL